MSTSTQQRHKTAAVNVGGVIVGGGAPIVVQSMTNTDTADVEGTARQVAALARAGSELVRITVDRDEAAAAVPHIKERLLRMGVDVPIVGDFHYIGHKLLADHPGLRRGARQIPHQSRQCRLQGQEGPAVLRHRRDGDQTRQAGAHRRQLGLARSGVADASDGRERPVGASARRPRGDARGDGAVGAAVGRARRGDRPAAQSKIIISAKVSAVQDLIAVYARTGAALRLCAASRPHRGRHGLEGHRRLVGGDGRAAAAGHRRHHPHFADARDRTATARWKCKVAQELLQTMGLRTFVPLVAACPGCGRTTSTTFQELAADIQKFIRDSMPEWKTRYPGVEGLNVAVMGCIVNGPGESKHADIGISLPGTGEQPTAPVFIDGKKAVTLRGPTVAADFKKIVIDYIERRFGSGGAGRRRRNRRAVAVRSRLHPAAAVLAAIGDPRFLQVQLVFDAAARFVGDLAVTQQLVDEFAFGVDQLGL